MSTYVKAGKPLEFDNAPDWLVGYMQYRLTVLNNTKEAVMTYFKNLREFFQWVSSYKIRGVNPRTEKILREIDILDLSLDTALDITKGDIETYLFFLSNTLNNSANTRNKKLVIIRSFYDYVLDHTEQLCVDFTANPAARVKRPKAPRKQPVYLPEEDQEALISSITGTENAVRDRAIILLCLTAGLRLSEVTGLDVSDLNLKNELLHIRNGKGGKDRTAYLTAPCCKALKDYLEEYRNLIEGLDSPALFVSQRNKERLTGRSIERAMRKYTLSASLGGKNYTPHKLRHTTATTLAKDGHNVMVIKEILGHEDISTSQIYMHLDNMDVAHAVSNSSLKDLGSTVGKDNEHFSTHNKDNDDRFWRYDI